MADFVDESGNPKWFSASLASNKTILDLANAARKAAALLSANLKFVKGGAELAKTLLLLKANALSLILNAIADELENMYNDLTNAGFYAIAINGQEEFKKKNKELKVTMTREFFAQMEESARTLDTLKGNEKMSNAYAKYLKKKTGEYSSDKLPETFQIDIDTDGWVSDYAKMGALRAGDTVGALDGIQSDALKQQTPSQFLAKLMQKFEDDADPNTPTFSGSGQMAAIIMLVGVPDASQLANLSKILSALGGFIGDVVIGSFTTLAEAINGMLTGPFIKKELVMTFYGVYGYKVNLEGEEETYGNQFKTGDFIKGEDSGWTMEVIKVESDDTHPGLGTKPSTFKFKTSKDTHLTTTGGVVTPIEDTVLEGTPFDYVVDQTLVLKQTGLGKPAEGFGQMFPGERVRLAEKVDRQVQELDNNGAIITYNVTDYQFVNPRKRKVMGGQITNISYPPIVYAYKNVPTDPAVVDPPAWGRYTLVDVFPAYGEFLKNILTFANFLRSFATGVTDEIDKIIAFIDDIIKTADEIVKSILALLAFFEALKDAGVYGLVIQDPSGSGLLKGGTAAMVSAIGSATGDESFPPLDDQGNMIITGEQGKRVKPPDSLRYTAGFCLVFGGPGATEAYETIAAIISPP